MNSTEFKLRNGVGSGAQVKTLPTASASYLGKIYQYIGTTTANYTNGYFYECVSDGAAAPTYSWTRKNVQPGMLPVSGTHTDEIAVLDSAGNVTYSGKTVEDFERADDDFDSAITGLLNPQTPSGLPMMAGQPSILFGNGTPQESVVPDNWNQYDPDTDTGYNWNGLPSVLGQQYINTAGGASGRYIGVKDGEYGLKWQNC